MKSQRVTLGQLRSIKLPAKKDDDEADILVAIRNTLAAHDGVGENYRVCVPGEVAAMIPKPEAIAPPAAEPTK